MLEVALELDVEEVTMTGIFNEIVLMVRFRIAQERWTYCGNDRYLEYVECPFDAERRAGFCPCLSHVRFVIGGKSSSDSLPLQTRITSS